MTLTAAEERELMRKIQWRLRAWFGHPEYDDMLGEAYWHAWRAYCRAQERGFSDPMPYVMAAASYAPSQWLRRWYGDRNHDTARYRAQHCSLDEQLARIEADEHVSDAFLAAIIDPVPGPEAQALARLENRALWHWIRRRATKAELAVFARHFVALRTNEEIAGDLGLKSGSVAVTLYRGLVRCRTEPEKLPTFPKPDTDYPRCRRGHYLTPGNVMGKDRVDGILRTQCRLCARLGQRARRARLQEQTSGSAAL